MNSFVQVAGSLLFLVLGYLSIRSYLPRVSKSDKTRMILASAFSFMLFLFSNAGGEVFGKFKRTAAAISGMDFAARYGPGYRQAVKRAYPFYWKVMQARDSIVHRGCRSVWLEGVDDQNHLERFSEILYPVRLDPKAPLKLKVAFLDGTIQIRIVKNRP